jgi:hypothetical protein
MGNTIQIQQSEHDFYDLFDKFNNNYDAYYRHKYWWIRTTVPRYSNIQTRINEICFSRLNSSYITIYDGIQEVKILMSDIISISEKNLLKDE